MIGRVQAPESWPPPRQSRGSGRTRRRVRALAGSGAARTIAAGVVLFLLGGTLAAVAAIPDSQSGEITGCYANSDGALRIIDAEAGETCREDETEISWGRGAPGPPGPPGQDGSTGPSGPQGTITRFGCSGGGSIGGRCVSGRRVYAFRGTAGAVVGVSVTLCG